MEEQIAAILRSMRSKATLNKMTSADVAKALGVNRAAVKHWYTLSCSPKPEALAKIKTWLTEKSAMLELETAPLFRTPSTEKQISIGTSAIREAMEHSQQIKHLLNAVEFELRYFANAKPEAREIYRDQVDPYDVSYVTTRLDAMAEETTFRRNMLLSNYQFNSFRRVKHAREKKDKS